MTAVAIHSALLPSGKIFFVVGSGYHPNWSNGPYEGKILDTITNSETNIPLTEDLFCGGSAGVPVGNLPFVGRTLVYGTNHHNCKGIKHGVASACILRYSSESLTKIDSMPTAGGI